MPVNLKKTEFAQAGVQAGSSSRTFHPEAINAGGKVQCKKLYWLKCKLLHSTSLLRFPFRIHIQVFLKEVLPVCRSKYPCSCFSSHFNFLVFLAIPFLLKLSVMLLTTVISLSLFFKIRLWILVLYHPRYLQCWRVLYFLHVYVISLM